MNDIKNETRQWNCLDPWPPQPEKPLSKTTIQDIVAKAKAHFPKKANTLFDEDPTENISDSCLKAVSQDLWEDDDRLELKSLYNIPKQIVESESECEKSFDDEELMPYFLAALGNDEKADLHSTMDANVWTDEFLKTFQYANLDRESVHSWVCNMIMVGYDHAHSSRDKSFTYILQSHSGAIVKLFHWEPSVKEMDEAYVYFVNVNRLPARIKVDHR